MKKSILGPVLIHELSKTILAIEYGPRPKSDDSGRFGELAVEWRVWGYRLALKITGCPEAAADAVQNALLRAYRNSDALGRAESPRAWFRKVLVHCAIDQKPKPAAPLEPGRPASDLDANLQVRNTLARLEPGHRVVLALALGEGLSYDEIAALLDIPSGTVGSRLHHAKEAFRKAWGDER